MLFFCFPFFLNKKLTRIRYKRSMSFFHKKRNKERKRECKTSNEVVLSLSHFIEKRNVFQRKFILRDFIKGKELFVFDENSTFVVQEKPILWINIFRWRRHRTKHHLFHQWTTDAYTKDTHCMINWCHISTLDDKFVAIPKFDS